MFSLLFGLYRHCTALPECHVLLLGLDNAGKTTLLERIKSTLIEQYNPLPPERIVPTVGLNIGRAQLQGTKFIFWDVGGQDGLRSIWPKYYAECEAVMFVVDSADVTDRHDEVKRELHRVLKDSALKGRPTLVVANKQDLSSAVTKERLADMLDITETKPQDTSDKERIRPLRIQPVCALSGDGVRDGLEWLIHGVPSL